MDIATQLPTWINEHRDEIVSDLIDLVSQETPSDDKLLLSAGLAWIERWLASRIGPPTNRRMVDGGKYGDTLVLGYEAAVRTDNWVTALCHYDTVWASGTLASWPPNVDGDRVTAPGVFDMKGGVVQLVWALKACTALGFARPNLRLVLNGDEEIGSPASRGVIEEEVVRGTAVLVLEASSKGAVKTSRKGAGIFRVDVLGQEAHAGLDPESGVSAIDEVSRIVMKLHAAADLSQGTSVNVGTLHAGTRTNVKAGRATANVDVRVSSKAEAQRIEELFAELKPHDPKAEITVRGGWNRPVMQRSAATASLFATATAAASELGFALEETSVGGYSDGNFAAALGLPVLDGLGAVGDGAHARHEWISIDGMLQRTALTSAILARLSALPPSGESLGPLGLPL